MRRIQIQSGCHWFSRRAFLGGGCTLVALPFLEALTAKYARGQEPIPPQRFLAWFFACGVPNINTWPERLGGLDGVRQKMTIVSGTQNVGQGPDHTYGTRAFLTGNYDTQSFDQALADQLAQRPDAAPIHSLVVGAEDNVCEPDGPCNFLNNISWGNNGNEVTKEMNAGAAFNRLFQGFDSQESNDAAASRTALRQSVLDMVHDDSNRLKDIVSVADRARLDEYMTNIRATEVELGNLAASSDETCGDVQGVEINGGGGYEQQIDAHTAVMALAFECDMTRVISFMMSAGATGKHNLEENTGYHLGITHRGVTNWEPLFEQVVDWEMQKFGALCERLDGKLDVDGQSTILDNTVAFCSSEISDGNDHNHDNMPVLLVGGLGGRLSPTGGQTNLQGVRFVDLFAYLGEAMDAPVNGFGDAGRIQGV